MSYAPSQMSYTRKKETDGESEAPVSSRSQARRLSDAYLNWPPGFEEEKTKRLSVDTM